MITMIINSYCGPSFEAKLINYSKVKKLSEIDELYVPSKVSFVEIVPNNSNDVKAIYNVAKYWENEHFASNISYTVQQLCQGVLDTVNHKVFALTKQKNKFDMLEDTKILGLIELEKLDKSVKINYLQVNPEFVYAVNPKYKGIGSKILDSIKKYYNTLIKVRSEYSATKFYEKNGFYLVDKNKFDYEWTPHI